MSYEIYGKTVAGTENHDDIQTCGSCDKPERGQGVQGVRHHADSVWRDGNAIQAWRIAGRSAHRRVADHPGNMTVVLKNMERDGFIERHKKTEDKHSSVLSLTDKGRAQIEEMLPKHAAVIEDIFSVLTLEEQKSLEALLKHFKTEEEDENG